MRALTTRDEPQDHDGGGILDVRLSGPPELVEEAVEAIRLVLEVVDASRPYPDRRRGWARQGQRVYLRARGLTGEARAFLSRGGAPR